MRLFFVSQIWDAYMNSGESYSTLAHFRYLGHMHASQTVWFQYNSVGIGHLSYD